MTYIHRVRPRYDEFDMQQVVHNAHYLAYCDDGCDRWLRAIWAEVGPVDWEVMVKKATITWSGATRLLDELEIAIEPVRWGTTSFDLGFEGTVDGRPVFSAVITYVAVRLAEMKPVRVPDEFRVAAGGPSAA